MYSKYFKEEIAMIKKTTETFAEIKKKRQLDIMKEALFYKFSQNPKLLNNLLWTGNSGIVYADSKDKIWGIGITAVEALMNVPWEGENLLGEALIETRTRFKNI